MSAERAALGLPVRLKGVVTVISGWKNSFFLQDSTSGISIDRLDTASAIHAGDQVVVAGVTASGAFAPIVLSHNVQILGKAPLPPANLLPATTLVSGSQDSQWLSMRGNVRTAEIKPVWGHSVLLLTLDIGHETRVEVHIRDFPPDAPTRLVGATVAIQGVCGTIFNDRRQFIGLRLFASSLADLTVIKPAPDDPFDVPTRSLADLSRFSDSVNIVDQFKVAGVVTWSKSHEGFYLQNGLSAAFIESPNLPEAVVGSTVEVVAYPSSRRGLSLLRAAAVRKTFSAPPLQPTLRTAAEMITIRDGFLSTPYDSQLVALQGRLLSESSGPSHHELLLQDGTHVFRAILPATSATLHLEPGSVVRVTGVCSVGLDDTREAASFELLVSTPTDVRLIQHPPWWSGRHALQALGAVIALLIGIIAWSALSRKRADLEELVVTDPLTALYNRRGFALLAQKQREIARRQHKDLLLFYLDVNHFKQINDEFGHRQGDRALQLVASALQKTFRESDILGRLGGDEFAVIAIDALANNQEALLARLCEEVEKTADLQGQPFHLSVSAGVVVCRHDQPESSFEDLLESADVLMYKQKKSRVDLAPTESFA